MPATEVPWPPMNFVAECVTMSAPWASGVAGFAYNVKTTGGDIKTLDDSGYEQNLTPTKNKNFGNTGSSSGGAALQAPRNVQLGFRLTF